MSATLVIPRAAVISNMITTRKRGFSFFENGEKFFHIPFGPSTV